MLGFGALALVAGCSKGAFSSTAQITSTNVMTIMAISSVYTRSGQTRTLSSSAFSAGGSPRASRSSLRTPLRKANQVKKPTVKINKTIGTLSSFVTISRKFGSVTAQPEKKRPKARMLQATSGSTRYRRNQRKTTKRITDRTKYVTGPMSQSTESRMKWGMTIHQREAWVFSKCSWAAVTSCAASATLSSATGGLSSNLLSLSSALVSRLSAADSRAAPTK